MNFLKEFDSVGDSRISNRQPEAIDSDVFSVVRDSISDFMFHFEGSENIITHPEVNKLDDFSALNKEISIQNVFIDNRWIPTSSYSARVVDSRNKTVTLELVIDKENLQTEERMFQQDFFENGQEIQLGQFFKVKCFRRPNCEMIQVIDGQGIVNEADFPSVDFSKIISTSLFK